MKYVGELFQEDAEYQAFVEKFKPKKTTDDCYTPPAVYEAVKEWAISEYGLQDREIVRPFWPGSDYKTFDYPAGCVVIDNPPFSILSQINRFYARYSVDFFLFSPTLTQFQCRDVNHVIAGANMVYENGAIVNTSFVTSLGFYRISTPPDLHEAIIKTMKPVVKNKPLKYNWPSNLVMASMIDNFAKNGVDFRVKREESMWIGNLDDMRKRDKGIYGSGFLVSNEIASRKNTAISDSNDEKLRRKEMANESNNASVIQINLSEAEKMVVESLSNHKGESK